MRHALRVKKRRGHRSLYCTVATFPPDASTPVSGKPYTTIGGLEDAN
jgi:hypothetical protein